MRIRIKMFIKRFGNVTMTVYTSKHLIGEFVDLFVFFRKASNLNWIKA